MDNLRLRLPDGGLCNAAALLFAEHPYRFLTSVQVKCGRFRGNIAVDFIDERTLEANVLTQLEGALAFVARNIRHAIRITGKPERDIVPEYPDEAVREAITNAICHRDYAAAGTVQVRIFDERLEVWNPATLPSDMTIEELYREHTSRPRNRKLAEAFYRARLIEQWGTGTLRMIKACEERGMPCPEFIYQSGSFIVRLRPSPEYPELPEPVSLKERQRKMLAYLQEHGRITASQYQALSGLSQRQARRDLQEMVQMGILIRRGSSSATHYLIPENGRRMAGEWPENP